jgi:hypothetical protein
MSESRMMYLVTAFIRAAVSLGTEDARAPMRIRRHTELATCALEMRRDENFTTGHEN